MNNFLKRVILISFLSFISLAVFNDTAEAATSSWKKIPSAGSTCEVRVWTDATTYTRNAKTVDFTAEQRGNCGNLNYGAGLSVHGLTSYYGPFTDGNFSKKTPIKKLSLNYEVFKRGYTQTAQVYVDLYKNSRNVGTAYSNNLYIHNRK